MPQWGENFSRHPDSRPWSALVRHTLLGGFGFRVQGLGFRVGGSWGLWVGNGETGVLICLIGVRSILTKSS